MVVQNGLRGIRSHGIVEESKTVSPQIETRLLLGLNAGTTDVSSDGCYNHAGINV